MEDAACRGPDGLRAEGIDRFAGQDHDVGAGRVGQPHHRPGIAGVRGLDEHGDQRARRREDVVDGRRRQGAPRHQTLRGDGVGQRRGGPVGDLGDGDPGGERGADDVDVPCPGGGGDVELPDHAGGVGLGGHRLAHRLRALGEELPDLVSAGLAQQPVGGGDPGRTLGQRTGNVGRPALGRDLAGLVAGRASNTGTPGRLVTDRAPGRGRTAAQAASSEVSSAAASPAGSAARATSTSAANAAASLTARSASTLRSTSTPAILRPWMNRL